MVVFQCREAHLIIPESPKADICWGLCQEPDSVKYVAYMKSNQPYKPTGEAEAIIVSILLIKKPRCWALE